MNTSTKSMMENMLYLISVMMSIAFFTLMERKLMGNMHFRKGPSKVIMKGLSQPLADAMKLMTKENMKMSMSKHAMYLMGPTLSIMMMLMCWTMYDFYLQSMMNSMKMLSLMSVMSLSIYGFLMMSWGSNSKYAMLGGYRMVAQVISYEVCLMIFLMVSIYLTKSYSTESMKMIQQGLWMSVAMTPLMYSWVMICLAESNRTPFDMSEGESEIVSGFNIEYNSGLFAFIFISEYGMIIMMSFITSMMFLGSTLLMTKTLIMCMMFIWTRCSFPRLRYDTLMSLSWKTILPYSISMCMMTIMIL